MSVTAMLCAGAMCNGNTEPQQSYVNYADQACDTIVNGIPPEGCPGNAGSPGQDPTQYNCPVGTAADPNFCGVCSTTMQCEYCPSGYNCPSDPCGSHCVPAATCPAGYPVDCNNGYCCPGDHPVCCGDGTTCGTDDSACGSSGGGGGGGGGGGLGCGTPPQGCGALGAGYYTSQLGDGCCVSNGDCSASCGDDCGTAWYEANGRVYGPCNVQDQSCMQSAAAAAIAACGG